ncbi:hypothetical protein [Nocardia vinacea]|uniref:hypothetical protein n=1 Tax=Nocardia vinacea TaxID=96468 RepID=UPI0002E90C24|nr:hypothetical protein [Nocardia vinacea]
MIARIRSHPPKETRLRNTLLVTSVLGAALVAMLPAGAADAQGPSDGSLKVQATTGTDQLPVTGVGVGITTCAAGPVLATLTTGGDGTVTQTFPDGCYQAQVTSVPSGCELASIAYVQINVAPGTTPVAAFQFRCA